MTSPESPHLADLLSWRAASKRTLWRWPAILSLAALVAALINHLFTLGCIAGCVLFATLPVFYVTTGRIVRGQPKPALAKQLLASLALLIVALILSPTFSISHQVYDDENNVTTTWIKRSILDSMREPVYRLDQLTWGQSSYDAHFVPSTTFCPRRSTQLYPLFGIDRDENLLDVLARSVDDWNSGTAPAPDTLKHFLARC